MAKPVIRAKPPAAKPLVKSATGKSALGKPAPTKSARGKPRAKPGRGPGIIGLFFVSVGLLWLAITALPVAVLLALGMIPSIVAYTVDQTPRRALSYTVGPLNLAGTAPYCLQLWIGANTVQGLGHILGNAWAWLVMYAAAGAGWLLHLGMPVIVRFLLERSIDLRRNRLMQIQTKLRAEWGDEVDPAVKSDGRGA